MVTAPWEGAEHVCMAMYSIYCTVCIIPQVPMGNERRKGGREREREVRGRRKEVRSKHEY
jgi:hypothetical protein